MHQYSALLHVPACYGRLWVDHLTLHTPEHPSHPTPPFVLQISLISTEERRKERQFVLESFVIYSREVEENEGNREGK